MSPNLQHIHLRFFDGVKVVATTVETVLQILFSLSVSDMQLGLMILGGELQFAVNPVISRENS